MLTKKRGVGRTKEERRKFMDSLEYSMELKHKNGLYYVMIPELCFIASNKNLEKAYENLEEQKQQYFHAILEGELDEALILPRRRAQSKAVVQELKIFTYKLLIICVLTALALGVGGAILVNKLTNISGAEIAKKVGKEVILQVKQMSDVSPEDQQKRREELHKMFQSIKPVVDEYNSVFKSAK